VAQTESYTYNVALKEIDGYVGKCKLQLISGDKVIIEQVGTLSKNAEGSLQFEPFKNVNYLKDSFGFTAIQFLPVEENKSVKEVSKQVREFTALRPSKPQKKYSSRKIVNAILISGSFIWLCFNLYIVSPSKFTLSSLNPVAETISVAQPVVTPSAKPVPVATSASPIVEAASPTVKETPPPAVAQEKKLPVFEATKIPASKIPDKSFLVIGGAFRSEENANNFLESLKNVGFNNAHILQKDEKLMMVCFDSFSTREEADAERKRIKTMQKDAWIYRN
jgi:cell division septation protein DedD